MSHSKIGASSYYRWKACPGSVRLCEDLPTRESSYAAEGTLAHSFAAEALKTGFIPVNCDLEMAEAVHLYLQTIKEDGTENLLIEQKFDLLEIHPELYGTCDAITFNESTGLLRVYDFKYGKGILVEVEQNSQLLYYALAALLKTKHKVLEIELVIIQPRASHSDGFVRRWRFDSFDILSFAAQLREDAKKTDDPQAPFNSGSHCRFCPAAGICPELAKQATALAKIEFSNKFSYDPKILSLTLDQIDVLENYAKSVREFAYQEAMHGRCPPGWKLVEKRAIRKWISEENTIKVLTDEFVDEQEMFDKSLKSPAQIEKILGKRGKDLTSSLTVAISSGSTLVKESDSRSSLFLKPKDVFEKIVN